MKSYTVSKKELDMIACFSWQNHVNRFQVLTPFVAQEREGRSRNNEKANLFWICRLWSTPTEGAQSPVGRLFPKNDTQ